MTPALPTLVVVFVVVLLGSIVASLLVLKRCLFVVQPNEALVLSGRPHMLPDGTRVGYRVVLGGRVLRIPILETVSRIDLTNLPVEIHSHSAYAKEGTPVDLHEVANVKVSSDPAIMRNAIERFLDRSREEIHRVATETLEGSLRQVVAVMSPRELVADPVKVAAVVQEETQADFEKLGLQLDTFKVKRVVGPGGEPIRLESAAEAPPSTASLEPPVEPPSQVAKVAELSVDTSELDKLADFSLGRSEREALAVTLVGRAVDSVLTVDRVDSTQAQVPNSYQGGRTVFGRRPSGLKLAVCLPAEGGGGRTEPQFGEEMRFQGRIHDWDDLYSHLVVLADRTT